MCDHAQGKSARPHEHAAELLAFAAEPKPVRSTKVFLETCSPPAETKAAAGRRR